MSNLSLTPEQIAAYEKQRAETKKVEGAIPASVNKWRKDPKNTALATEVTKALNNWCAHNGAPNMFKIS